jgi:PAS domain S-box-containing protein
MELTANADEELRLWKERYRALFEKNVAAVIITTPAGRMVDCNEAFTQMVGFGSRAEVLARTAWDFYFDPRDRDAVISESCVLENCVGDELRLRRRDGMPRWVKVTRAVISRLHDRPELLQGTLVDITEEKKAAGHLGEIMRVGLPDGGPSKDAPRISLLKEIGLAAEIQGLLHSMNEALQPDRLGLLSKTEVRDVVLGVERLKVLLEELEILRLSGDLRR